MAESSLSDLVNLINQQIEIGEQLEECLYKAECLSLVTLLEDFLLLPKPKIDGYFLILQDVLEQAIELNQKALKKLILSVKLVKK